MSSMKIPVVGTGVDTSATGGDSPTQPAAPSRPGDPPRYLSQVPRAEQSLHSFHLQEGSGEQAPEESGNSFHPDLDPSKYDISFDQFGRISRSPKEPLDESPAEEVVAQAQTSPPPTNEVETLRNHVNQLTQVVLGMAKEKPVSQPAAPDYSDIDMYDPAQAAELVRRVVQETMGEVVKTHIDPQVSRMDQANAQTQVNQILDKYGREAVESRGPLLMELAKSNPTSSVQELWNLADSLVGPVKTGNAKPASPNQAARTITPEQAKQKAEQARRLAPGSNNGVSAAGRRQGPPERMLKNLALGSIAAWNSLNKGT